MPKVTQRASRSARTRSSSPHLQARLTPPPVPHRQPWGLGRESTEVGRWTSGEGAPLTGQEWAARGGGSRGVGLELGLLAVGEGAGTMLICAGQEAPAPASDTPAKAALAAPWPYGGGEPTCVGGAGSCFPFGLKKGASRRGRALFVEGEGQEEQLGAAQGTRCAGQAAPVEAPGGTSVPQESELSLAPRRAVRRLHADCCPTLRVAGRLPQPPRVPQPVLREARSRARHPLSLSPASSRGQKGGRQVEQMGWRGGPESAPHPPRLQGRPAACTALAGALLCKSHFPCLHLRFLVCDIVILVMLWKSKQVSRASRSIWRAVPIHKRPPPTGPCS